MLRAGRLRYYVITAFLCNFPSGGKYQFLASNGVFFIKQKKKPQTVVFENFSQTATLCTNPVSNSTSGWPGDPGITKKNRLLISERKGRSKTSAAPGTSTTQQPDFLMPFNLPVYKHDEHVKCARCKICVTINCKTAEIRLRTTIAPDRTE